MLITDHTERVFFSCCILTKPDRLLNVISIIEAYKRGNSSLIKQAQRNLIAHEKSQSIAKSPSQQPPSILIDKMKPNTDSFIYYSYRLFIV